MPICHDKIHTQSSFAAEHNALGLTNTPTRKRTKSQVMKNIFQDDHTYSYSSKEKKQKTDEADNEKNETVTETNPYLTLRNNILKKIWKIEEPNFKWAVYCNEISNKVLFADFEFSSITNHGQSSKIVIILLHLKI